MRSGQTDRSAALSAAVRRYPQFELAIRRLIDADESFRDICEELADAELALSGVDKLPIALREARRAEWQELVDRLVEELRAVLMQETVARSRVGPRAPR
jgi:hypothetical protein